MAETGAVHHIEMNVSDLVRSAAFWGWFLEDMGYRPHQVWEHGRSWIKGETYIVLVQTEAQYLPSAYYRKNTGLNHLAFHAKSRDDVDRITAALREKGIPILYQGVHPHAGGPGHYAVYFEDPDRIKVEVSAP